eukprot:CAMPEP_0174928824 /NCGR_PEP_ID=MMETSP1355-20121228/26252_1 /TAXON_ID=464990 /ORGANISM="Hemiselmis tepida, Strain CCMP443" /LENGTH=239 /DNA_ID=CAMNT_0016175001 /DNA_START=95 /DNA_END=810 /DNA_ORIENTATION=+
MRFALNAATTVSFGGEQTLHGLLAHRFSGEAVPSLTMRARARQFSSFVVMAGKIAGPGLFDPLHAAIVKDKDDLLMPLLLDPMPTPGEFRDAIASLSPEQQRFARALRAMQLESSVFAVLVVQIKPQMEALLGLPPGALTKEIALNQQLLELFTDYQVPSDLLTFSGDASAPLADKVSAVRGHAASLMDMVKSSKERELEDERQRARYADPLRVAGRDFSDGEEEECEEAAPLCLAPPP